MGTWLNVFYPVRVAKVLAGIGFLVLDLTQHRQPEELRSVIMQSIVEGLIAIDGEGRLTCMNAAAEQMLGWREEELRGRDLRTILHLNRPDDAAPPAHDCPLARSRTKRLTARPLEDAFVCRSGTLLPVLCDATPVPGMGVVIMFRDASEEIQRRLRAETALDAVTWVGRIREALDEDRMEIYSQPIISLAGAPDREELLLRMITRDGQVLSAGAFLPAAEEFGLILEIDRWVIAQAVRLAARGRLVQVNLSVASTADGRLLEFIEQELCAGDAPPANVIFELTETALMRNMAAGEAFAAGLRELGCGLVLDDFGTGFGTLTYLQRLPVQSLKIDVDFVRDLPTNPANQHLVRAILGLARSFAIDAIAEGVEDEQTLTLLRAYGVQYAQGYHIGRPLPCV
jgi:PAS domain S-box-containing protein